MNRIEKTNGKWGFVLDTPIRQDDCVELGEDYEDDYDDDGISKYERWDNLQ